MNFVNRWTTILSSSWIWWSSSASRDKLSDDSSHFSAIAERASSYRLFWREISFEGTKGTRFFVTGMGKEVFMERFSLLSKQLQTKFFIVGSRSVVQALITPPPVNYLNRFFCCTNPTLRNAGEANTNISNSIQPKLQKSAAIKSFLLTWSLPYPANSTWSNISGAKYAFDWRSVSARRLSRNDAWSSS